MAPEWLSNLRGGPPPLHWGPSLGTTADEEARCQRPALTFWAGCELRRPAVSQEPFPLISTSFSAPHHRTASPSSHLSIHYPPPPLPVDQCCAQSAVAQQMAALCFCSLQCSAFKYSLPLYYVLYYTVTTYISTILGYLLECVTHFKIVYTVNGFFQSIYKNE